MSSNPSPAPAPEPTAVPEVKPRDEQIEIHGLTHPGKVRATNQDHFLVCSLHKTCRVRATSLPNPELVEVPSDWMAFLGMVADGVGGREGGEEASRATLEAVAAYATHTMNCYYANDAGDPDAFYDALRQAARECQETVLGRSRARPELRGLATTLTLLFSVWPWHYVLHVGDSRAYRLRGGRLERLTHDQTLAQALVDEGVLTAERASRSPFASVLSSAIGGEVNPEVARFDAHADDVLLLCTDGLTRHVSDQRIRDRLLAMTAVEQTARALLEDALEAGGSDNITLVLGRARPA